jgi:hypothetical protein
MIWQKVLTDLRTIAKECVTRVSLWRDHSCTTRNTRENAFRNFPHFESLTIQFLAETTQSPYLSPTKMTYSTVSVSTMHVDIIESPPEPETAAENDKQLAAMQSVESDVTNKAKKSVEYNKRGVDDALEHLLAGRDEMYGATDDKGSKENREPPPAKDRRAVDEGEIPVIIKFTSKRAVNTAPGTVAPARDASTPPLTAEQSRRSLCRTKTRDDCLHRHPDLVAATSDSYTTTSLTPELTHNEDDRVQLSRHGDSRALFVSPSPAQLPQDDDECELIIPNAARLNRIMDSLIIKTTSISHPRRAPRSFGRTLARGQAEI